MKKDWHQKQQKDAARQAKKLKAIHQKLENVVKQEWINLENTETDFLIKTSHDIMDFIRKLQNRAGSHQ